MQWIENLPEFELEERFEAQDGSRLLAEGHALGGVSLFPPVQVYMKDQDQR